MKFLARFIKWIVNLLKKSDCQLKGEIAHTPDSTGGCILNGEITKFDCFLKGKINRILAV